MFNEEDITIASLAKIVGNELHTIDKNSEPGRGLPANKLDPKSFLASAKTIANKNKHVVYKDGKQYYAGIDETYVQSLYPDPPAAKPQTIPQPSSLKEEVKNTHVTINRDMSISSSKISTDVIEDIVKTLKSIDKTLKSINKQITISIK